MLAPDTRGLLLDALRPPVGKRLDHAVATTFTLDVESALIVPLALAGFNLRGTPDPMAILESLRGSADKVDIFCQAGMMKASGWPGELAGLLEESIHALPRPRPGHLFHPKIWVLRFVDDDGVPEFRCIVSSRNLTGERSWDVILRLESDPSDSSVNRENRDLVDLLRYLPQSAAERLSEVRRERIFALGDELRRVHWEMPDDVDRVTFHTFGVKNRREKSALRQLFRGYRHLIISPFISEAGLDVLVGDSPQSYVQVVSRPDQIDALPPVSLEGRELFSISPMAGLEEDDDEVSPEHALLGELHAKVFVVESNRLASVFIGSANATENAFGGNVEILCELVGGATRLGADTVMGEKAAFREILEPYQPSGETRDDQSSEARRRVESFLVDLAECIFTLSVGQENEAGYATRLVTDRPIPLGPSDLDLNLHVAPYNRDAERRALHPGELVDIELEPREVGDLTAFFLVTAFTVTAQGPVEARTLICARMLGAPPDRVDGILARRIDSPDKFLTFLRLLLSIGDGIGAIGFDATEGSGSWSQGSAQGILELLLEALAVQPESIDRLEGIVEKMMSTEGHAKNLPEGCAEDWSAVKEARRVIGRPTS
jgi:hypothetical protein